MKWIQFIDSGGQLQYHDILPLFVPNTGVSIFVFKLSEELSEHPMIEYYVDGKPVGKPYQSPLSHEQILMQCIGAMCSQDAQLGTEREEEKDEEIEEERERSTQIIIVGTHSDKAGDCTEPIEDKEKRLNGLLRDNCPLFHCGEQMTKVIFAMNGKVPKDEDKDCALVIRNQIVSMFPESIKMPIAWFCLEANLRSISDDGILSLEKCQECAKSLHIEGEVFEAALYHLVHHNVFLYYPEVLPKVVFCDPQVVLTKVSELVQYNHQLRYNPDGSKGVHGDLMKFKDQGKLSVKLLKQERFKKSYKVGLFTEKDLLELLVHIGAIAKIKKGEYLMPALLPHLDDDTALSMYLQHDTLMIRFVRDGKQRCIPSGLFCCLVAYLLSTMAWKVCMEGDKPLCMHRNCITFERDGTTDIVTLVDTFFAIGVHVNAPSSKACREIRECVHSGIKHVLSKLKYRTIEPEDAFLCGGKECTSEPRHLAEVVLPQGKWKCTKKRRQHGGLSGGQLMWLSESSLAKQDTTAGQ